MIKFYDRVADNVLAIREYSVVSRLILFGAKKRKSNYTYESFLPAEVDFAVLAKKLSHRFLGPVVTAQDLHFFQKKYPEIRFYRRKNETEITFALWNQSKFRRLLLTEMPWFITLIRWTWNLLGKFTGAHVFPKSGEAWSSAELTFLVEKNMASDFEDFIVSEAFDLGCHTLNLIEGGLGDDYPKISIKGPCYRAQLKLMSYSLDGLSPLTAPQFMMADVDLGFV
jgi:hypothetical protein